MSENIGYNTGNSKGQDNYNLKTEKPEEELTLAELLAKSKKLLAEFQPYKLGQHLTELLGSYRISSSIDDLVLYSNNSTPMPLDYLATTTGHDDSRPLEVPISVVMPDGKIESNYAGPERAALDELAKTYAGILETAMEEPLVVEFLDYLAETEGRVPYIGGVGVIATNDGTVAAAIPGQNILLASQDYVQKLAAMSAQNNLSIKMNAVLTLIHELGHMDGYGLDGSIVKGHIDEEINEQMSIDFLTQKLSGSSEDQELIHAINYLEKRKADVGKTYRNGTARNSTHSIDNYLLPSTKSRPYLN